MTILLGLAIIAAGSAMMYYSRQLGNLTGRWKFAEDYFGSAAAGFAVLGMCVIVLGVLLGLGAI